MTATLTERYIAAAVASIPPASRDDVQAELDVSIADAIDTRIDQGERRAVAERAVLNDLGDPGILAAGYADRPLHLIGPRFYLAWWRLLKLLWAIVPATAMGGVALGQAIAEAPIGEIMGTTIATGVSAFMHVSFWVTLVFAVMERTGNDSALPDWNVDQLPDTEPKGAGRADMIASLVFLVIGAGVLLWDQLRGLVIQGGVAFPVLDPRLWPWWITGLLILMAAKTALVIAVYLTRRWNAAFAVINTALALVFAIAVMTLLLAGTLVNPKFVTTVFTDNGVDSDTVRILAVLVGAGITGFSAWDIIDGWLKTIRGNRR